MTSLTAVSGPHPQGHNANGDVAIGNYARQATVVAGRERAGVDRHHHARGVPD
jgi:hypothetical protein